MERGEVTFADMLLMLGEKDVELFKLRGEVDATRKNAITLGDALQKVEQELAERKK